MYDDDPIPLLLVAGMSVTGGQGLAFTGAPDVAVYALFGFAAVTLGLLLMRVALSMARRDR